MSGLSTPAAIRTALRHVVSQTGEGLWLVGGSALAGFYANHRRSDDLDLFALDLVAFQSAQRAARSLNNVGAELVRERASPTYYHADILFQHHSFTLDIVLDENLKRVGRAIQTASGVWVADLKTLFAMKAACLVSRCSEKDLFDLDWIFQKVGLIDVESFVKAGVEIDGGLTVETLLFSLKDTNLRKEACHFLLPQSPLSVDQAYQRIKQLQQGLIQSLRDYEKKHSPPPEADALAQAVKDQKKRK